MADLDEYYVVSGAPGTTTKITLVLDAARARDEDGVPESNYELVSRIAAEMGGIAVRKNKANFWPDRKYRNAWRFDAGTGEINIDTDVIQREIIMKVRQKRNAKLCDQDTKAMRALEEGDTAALAQVQTKKRMLRNLPPQVEARLKAKLRRKKTQKTRLAALEAFRVSELEEED